MGGLQECSQEPVPRRQVSDASYVVNICSGDLGRDDDRPAETWIGQRTKVRSGSAGFAAGAIQVMAFMWLDP